MRIRWVWASLLRLSAEHAQGLTDLFDRLVEVGKAVGEDMTIGAEDDLRAEGFEYEPLVDLDIEEGDEDTPLGGGNRRRHSPPSNRDYGSPERLVNPLC